MNYYNEIKNLLIDNEITKKVKTYSINKNDLSTYYEVGKMLANAGKHYGEGIINEYSKKLTYDLGKGYSKRNLWLMLRFFQIIEKVQTMSAQLSWSHYCEIIMLDDINKIRYYINMSEKNRLSVRQLRLRIKSKEYERLPIETKNKLTTEDKIKIKDLVPNPILLKNKNNINVVTEKALHQLILEDIESFMMELGNSFSFIGSEYRIKIGDRYYYIDLLLFNIKYNCYVVVELKVTEFKVEYISQVQKYMNYIDRNIKEINNNDTIGIIICKKDNKFVIEYCSDDRITIREYELV